MLRYKTTDEVRQELEVALSNGRRLSPSQKNRIDKWLANGGEPGVAVTNSLHRIGIEISIPTDIEVLEDKISKAYSELRMAQYTDFTQFEITLDDFFAMGGDCKDLADELAKDKEAYLAQKAIDVTVATEKLDALKKELAELKASKKREEA